MPYSKRHTMLEGRSTEEISIDFYHESLLLSAILEAFVYSDEYLFPDLNTWVFTYIENGLLHTVTMAYYNKCITKLYSIGLIDICGKNGNSDTIIRITEAGKAAIQNQIFSSLAQATLYNYQASVLNKRTYELNKGTLKLNKSIKKLSCATLITAVVSAIVSIIALIITIHNNC